MEPGTLRGALVRFHYLPMPALLRRSGSFGTHWMMQEQIRSRHVFLTRLF
jgi:hypothetical protein